jgi:hypothetical protein
MTRDDDLGTKHPGQETVKSGFHASVTTSNREDEMSKSAARSTNLLDLEEDGSNSPTPSTEIVVLTIKECFIYKVPPLRSASGHR